MTAEQQIILAPSVLSPERGVIAACQPNIVEVFPLRVAGHSFAPSNGCTRKEHDSFCSVPCKVSNASSVTVGGMMG